MAIGAILGSVLTGAIQANPQTRFQQFRQEFQQLGKDLQSGNLAQAQADFVTLQQSSPLAAQAAAASSATPAAASTSAASGASSGSPIAQAFNQLSQDLKSGNLSAAQQDFSTIQQDFQNAQAQGQGGGGHHHHIHAESQSSQSSSPLAQLFAQLGQALQTGNLSSAQQAYSTLQQDFQQFASSGLSAVGSAASQIATGALNLVA
jgi:outer membrane protein assembly factor BamD (BamD/ComL family)